MWKGGKNVTCCQLVRREQCKDFIKIKTTLYSHSTEGCIKAYLFLYLKKGGRGCEIKKKDSSKYICGGGGEKGGSGGRTK